jgi:hypothetical protein
MLEAAALAPPTLPTVDMLSGGHSQIDKRRKVELVMDNIKSNPGVLPQFVPNRP